MELIRDLRTNGHLLVAKVLTLTLVALSLYTYGTFVQSTDEAVDTSLSSRADVDLYTLIDDFLDDPDGFARFHESPERIEQVAAFVEMLDAQEGISFISSYDQPVPVVDFRGGDRFDIGYGTEYTVNGVYEDDEGRSVRDVKSIQLNRTAYDFAGLEVARGAEPDWASIDYGPRTVPVVLGADYEGVYDLGDTFDGQFMFRDMTFEVVGFLAPDSAMYFRGEINHFVDDTVLIPYPARFIGLSPDDQSFAGMLDFQVLNSDLAVDPRLSTDDVLARLDRIAQETGFTDYSLIGVPTYVVQLAQVRQLVQDNLGLLSGILALLVVSGVVAVVFLNVMLTRRRRPVWSVYTMAGHGRGALVRVFAPCWLLEHGVVLLAFIVVTSVLPNADGVPQLIVGALLLAWMTVDGLTQRQSLLIGAAARRKDTS